MRVPYERAPMRGFDAWCMSPFYKEEDAPVLESYPSFFAIVAAFLSPARRLKTEMSPEVKMEFMSAARQGFDMFLRQDSIKEILPRSTEKAEVCRQIVEEWLHKFALGISPIAFVESVAKGIDGFMGSLQDELDRIPMFTVMPKGNMDIRKLAGTISKGLPKSTLELLNEFVCNDIDHSGRCLAFDLPTSSGFHILRAVETCAKAYVHAATGTLPPIKNRNWGEYIFQLKNAGAHEDVTDLLRILKAKRNPLMHPYDNLNVDEAISLLCICQAGMDTIVDDLRRRSLEVKFAESLKALPSL